jgi:hypothetical protein
MAGSSIIDLVLSFERSGCLLNIILQLLQDSELALGYLSILHGTALHGLYYILRNYLKVSRGYVRVFHARKIDVANINSISGMLYVIFPGQIVDNTLST